MREIFLLGTCRVHRPFGSDEECVNNKKYNVSNLWHSSAFLGPKYGTKEIIQFLDFALNDNHVPEELVQLIFADCIVSTNIKEQLNKVKFSFALSEVVVVEISTIKQIVTNIDNKEYHLNCYAYRAHNNHIQDNTNLNCLESTQSEDELCADILQLQQLFNTKYYKKVLFVTHFNHNDIKNRELIIKCVKKCAKFWFDPSQIVIDNLPHSVVDNGEHMSRDTEILVMEALHEILSKM
jgi:hypothetical protein